MTNDNYETCDMQVWRGDDWNGDYQICGKPIKRRGLCGIHARSADTQDAERKKANENAEMATALTRTLGVRVHYRSNGTFVISRFDAEEYIRAYAREGD